MALIVAAGDAERAADELRAFGETVYVIGAIEKSSGKAEAIIV